MSKSIIFDWIGTLVDRDTGPYTSSENILNHYKDRGYKLALVSKRSDPSKGYRELKNFNLEKYFDVIVIAQEKETAQFEKALKQLKSNPKETIVVGDRTVREIKIGNQLGCITIWIKSGEHAIELPTSETGNPTYTIGSLEELTSIID